MATSKDTPEPQWLIQEPEGAAAPKTPGRWKSLWASDCVRLEEGHRTGKAEVLVYGRKYVVDMKERTVRALYWKEEPAKRAVMRATYFLRKGGGWVPYSEEDSETLENSYGSAIVQLRGEKCTAVDVPLSNGISKVVMTKATPAPGVVEEPGVFKMQYSQKPVKAPSMLTTTFLKTTFEVHRGTPESGGWGGVPSSEGDIPYEGKPPRHLVFVVHGCGESLWSKSSSALTSLRNSMGPMRDMSAEFLRSQRNDDQTPDESVGEGKGGGREGEPQSKELDKGEKKEAVVLEGGGDGEGVGKGAGAAAEYVEFLPVEWFGQVHGADALSDRLVQDVTLESIPSFREFANQAFMDIMYYLTPMTQERISKAVVEEMNRMWEAFSKYTPEFSGKVSVVGHSLGSLIAHDVLMAQPARGQAVPARTQGGAEIPVLGFYPEVLLMCGSPVGMFLSLRESTIDTGSLFKFKTTNRFFNLFHLYDPVAYRLEPLIDRRLRDLQPEHVPHRGGDRIHVTVKKFKGDVDAALNKVSKTTGASLMAIQRTLTTTVKSVTGDTTEMGTQDVAIEGEVVDAREKLEERIDWVLQESPLEGMHPWASAVFAHSSYFQSMDMIMFLVNALDESLAPENPDIGELVPKKEA